jgi:hypothetical protein
MFCGGVQGWQKQEIPKGNLGKKTLLSLKQSKKVVAVIKPPRQVEKLLQKIPRKFRKSYDSINLVVIREIVDIEKIGDIYFHASNIRFCEKDKCLVEYDSNQEQERRLDDKAYIQDDLLRCTTKVIIMDWQGSFLTNNPDAKYKNCSYNSLRGAANPGLNIKTKLGKNGHWQVIL